MSPYSISSPYWWARPWDTKAEGGEIRLCSVWGISKICMNDYDTYEDGGSRVDASIAPLILKLNMVGLRTLFCCSGLRADHRGWIDNRWFTGPQNGYISFETDLPDLMLGLLVEPLAPDGRTIIRARPEATDEGLAVAWRTLEQRLDECVAEICARRSVGA